MFADVLFPLRLRPFTYRIPENAPADLEGRIVAAPFMNKVQYGLVTSVQQSAEGVKKRIKELASIHESFASASYLDFIKWLGAYYLTPPGVALKSSFFDEAVAGLNEISGSKRRYSKKRCSNIPDEELLHNRAASAVVEHVVESVDRQAYSSLLFHASSLFAEYALLLDTLKKIASQNRGIIVLVPEAGFIEKLSPIMSDLFAERFCTIHSKLSKKDRITTIKNIISGKSDVILGTRSAILAPIPKLSLVAVLEEHSPSYKGEEGLRYNARDLAVMRGYTDKACVLLSSICPSLESVFNARRGKYNLLNDTNTAADHRPQVRIFGFKSRKQSEISLGSDVVNAARNLLQKEESVLFLAGRRGYSLIRCDDCGNIESCSKCFIPMMFHKSTGMLKCHHCGQERRIADSCTECGGASLKRFSAGTERIKEDVEALLSGPSLLVESTKLKANACVDNAELPDFVPFVIGTSKAKRKNCSLQKYSAAVLMNIDLLLAQPDFRAYEHAFQELIEVSQLVKNDGQLFIQTKAPDSKVLKCMKYYDFEGFYDLELSQRKALDNPPFSRVILFNIFSKNTEPIFRELNGAIPEIKTEAVSIMGPLEATSPSKLFTQYFQVLMKSRDTKKLREAAKIFLSRFDNDSKIKIIADVDPIKI